MSGYTLLADLLPSRIQGGARDGTATHNSPFYQHGFKWALRYLKRDSITGLILDPFARNCVWGDITNDLNPDFETTHNMDAEDFLKDRPAGSAKLILFDPPFSDRMDKDKYGGQGNLYASDASKIIKCQNNLKRILKPGGLVIKLGYNSGRPFGLELVSCSVVNFGGCRNDVIMTIWRNPDSSILRWGEEE